MKFKDTIPLCCIGKAGKPEQRLMPGQLFGTEIAVHPGEGEYQVSVLSVEDKHSGFMNVTSFRVYAAAKRCAEDLREFVEKHGIAGGNWHSVLRYG